MHHTLPLYSRFQNRFLKLYMLLIKTSRLPFIGRLVRYIANAYGRSQHGGYLITRQEAEQLIDISSSVWLAPCSCRRVFKNCDIPVMTEIVISNGHEIYSKKNGVSRITREEAKSVLRKHKDKNVIHTIMHCHGLFYAICTCCPCCCVPYRLKKEYNIGQALIRKADIVDDYRRQAADEKAVYI
jgi:hypothetical protein